MTTNRIVSGILTLVLMTLLGWSVFAGFGDVRIWITLGVGAAIGILYTVLGRLPEWIVDHSGGSITRDQDPTNLAPRIYLPILIGVVVVAVAVFSLVLWFF